MTEQGKPVKKKKHPLPGMGCRASLPCVGTVSLGSQDRLGMWPVFADFRETEDFWKGNLLSWNLNEEEHLGLRRSDCRTFQAQGTAIQMLKGENKLDPLQEQKDSFWAWRWSAFEVRVRIQNLIFMPGLGRGPMWKPRFLSWRFALAKDKPTF